MSYQTLEVDLDNGRVRPLGAETLPAKARALLTIVEEANATHAPPSHSLADALRRLKVKGLGMHNDLSTNKTHLNDFGK